MPIRQAKSVDRLYDDCRAYDLVIVPDPPLGDSLNRRVERPQFGSFAITPRRLAAGGRETGEDRLAFLEVIKRTDLSWKEAAYTIGNVLQCWEHHGDPTAIREYPSFATPATEIVIDSLRGVGTTSERLTECSIDEDADVAVVGIDQLTPLERSILPDEYEVIDPFTDDVFDPPTIQRLDSPAAIVDALMETVTPKNADRVGIVLDRQSAYSPLIESALETAEIPYHGGPRFADDPAHRAFRRFLRVAHRGGSVTVTEARPLLRTLGASIDVEHDEKRLATLDDPAADRLRALSETVVGATFDRAVAAFEAETAVELDPFRDELAVLGLLDEPVTAATVDDLAFYLRTYDVPIDRQNEGVLLADANAAAYVDRPAVFYLGLDETWTHASPRRPWIDRDREYDRHIQEFQLLLQNGRARYYFVQDARGGEPVTPCLYFEELLDRTVEDFADLDSEPRARPFRPTGNGFDRTPVDVPSTTVETVSQSGLSTLVNCPRDYLFGRLLDSPDTDYFRVGTLFHDFAEVYATHPTAFDEETLEAVVELMLSQTAAFDRDIDRSVNATRYRIGLETIAAFLDERQPSDAPFLTGGRGEWTNDVAAHLGLTVDSSHTEWWFEERELGLKGKIDLVLHPDHLLDYKSGTRHSTAEVVRNSAIDPPGDTPDFQALLYLTYLRNHRPGERLQFTFFHFLETLDDVVAGDPDLDACLTTITYHPISFESYLSRETVFDELCEEGSGACRKTLGQVEFEAYEAVVREHSFPDTRESEELMAAPIGRALLDMLRETVGDYVYVENGCAQALRQLRDMRDTAYFEEDLDAFESFVDERIAELNRYRAGERRFPVAGHGGEPNWRWVDHRDCILEGDG